LCMTEFQTNAKKCHFQDHTILNVNSESELEDIHRALPQMVSMSPHNLGMRYWGSKDTGNPPSLFFCSTRLWTQGLSLARQVLYHFRHELLLYFKKNLNITLTYRKKFRPEGNKRKTYFFSLFHLCAMPNPNLSVIGSFHI
jgi:hypothetical protein